MNVGGQSLIILIISIVLVSCSKYSDTIEYDTYVDAKNDGLFEKLILPSIIPKNSYNFFLKIGKDGNNHGFFKIPKSSVILFSKKLQKIKFSQVEISRYTEKELDLNYKTFKYTSKNELWIFWVSSNDEKVFFERLSFNKSKIDGIQSDQMSPAISYP